MRTGSSKALCSSTRPLLEKTRRVAIIRKAQVVDDGQSLLIFEMDWRYEAIVTNLESGADCFMVFLQATLRMENYIKEAKSGFSIDRIAPSDFGANELDLLIKLLAYNLYERLQNSIGDRSPICFEGSLL